jgi:transcription initiation factor IIF auxiliary subunit
MKHTLEYSVLLRICKKLPNDEATYVLNFITSAEKKIEKLIYKQYKERNDIRKQYYFIAKNHKEKINHYYRLKVDRWKNIVRGSKKSIINKLIKIVNDKSIDFPIDFGNIILEEINKNTGNKKTIIKSDK